MKSALPKQFLLLAGRPVLMHTIERFSSFDPLISLILVLPAEHHDLWRQLCEEHSFVVSHRVVAGGEERFHSVRAGLECVKGDVARDGLRYEAGQAEAGRSGAGQAEAGRSDADQAKAGRSDAGKAEVSRSDAGQPEVGRSDAGQAEAGHTETDVLIAIHDGVRPLVSHDTIWRCFSDAEEFGNAVPFIEPADSVRVLDGDDSRPVSRSEVRLIQTPQVFRGSVIMKAYDRDFDPSFTDDATVAEADGVKIHLTHGNRENLKITTPEDLAVAATLAGILRQ